MSIFLVFLCMCCTPCDLWFEWLWVSGSAHSPHPPLVASKCAAVKETRAIRRLLLSVSYDTESRLGLLVGVRPDFRPFELWSILGSSEKNKTVGTLAETSRKVGKEGEPSAQPHTLKKEKNKAWNEGDGRKAARPASHRAAGLEQK